LRQIRRQKLGYEYQESAIENRNERDADSDPSTAATSPVKIIDAYEADALCYQKSAQTEQQMNDRS
jgi:hypothetical protein